MCHPIPSVTFMIKTPNFFAGLKSAWFFTFLEQHLKILKASLEGLFFFLFQLEHFCNSLKGTGSYAIAFKVLILL